jgi:hypothetical protein
MIRQIGNKQYGQYKFKLTSLIDTRLGPFSQFPREHSTTHGPRSLVVQAGIAFEV